MLGSQPSHFKASIFIMGQCLWRGTGKPFLQLLNQWYFVPLLLSWGDQVFWRYSVTVLLRELMKGEENSPISRLAASVPQFEARLEGLTSLKIPTLSPALWHLHLAPSGFSSFYSLQLEDSSFADSFIQLVFY